MAFPPHRPHLDPSGSAAYVLTRDANTRRA